MRTELTIQSHATQMFCGGRGYESQKGLFAVRGNGNRGTEHPQVRV